MTDTDPLLRAVAQGNPSAPDGQALVALGQLVRRAAHPPRSVDLTARIIADIHAPHGSTDIDSWVERGSCADPELQELLTMTRAATSLPRAVDLTGRVRLRLGAGRLFDVLDDRTGVVRRRVRICAAVLAGHIAAGMLFALIHLNLTTQSTDTSTSHMTVITAVDGHQTSSDAWSSLMPPRLPQAWTMMRDLNADLFLLRRAPALRHEALRRASLNTDGPAIADTVRWLLAHHDERTGIFGSLVDGRDRNLATQSLATLAIMGEGCTDPAHVTAVRSSLHWLMSELERGPAARPGHIPLSLASLALVEGSLLLADDELRAAAERTLARLSAERVQPDAEGWTGFSVLAIETAQQGGLRVPGALLMQSRRAFTANINLHDHNAIGCIGATSFSRLLLGLRAAPDTAVLTALLATASPTADHDETFNIIGWFFASLALRESGDASWPAWARSVNEHLSSRLVNDQEGRYLPEACVRDADFVSDKTLFATSLAILTLQAPYRYLPVE